MRKSWFLTQNSKIKHKSSVTLYINLYYRLTMIQVILGGEMVASIRYSLRETLYIVIRTNCTQNLRSFSLSNLSSVWYSNCKINLLKFKGCKVRNLIEKETALCTMSKNKECLPHDLSLTPRKISFHHQLNHSNPFQHPSECDEPLIWF